MSLKEINFINNSKNNKEQKKVVYVIQRHYASHLHYDLRLEENGVLKSWALPKDPPSLPGVKRLAIQTEDHPLGYEDFEGTIPEGLYGAGKVEIWDKGYYKLIESTEEKKIIEIFGKKLKGKYALVKLKTKNNWLFLKLKRRSRIEAYLF
jgi:DNA ligase D-like protein (predicted 3'-phosphoesterase)